MAVTKIKPVKGTLNKALDYIQNPDKTDGKMLLPRTGAGTVYNVKDAGRGLYRGLFLPYCVTFGHKKTASRLLPLGEYGNAAFMLLI